MEVQSTNLTVFAYSNCFMEDLLGNQPCKDGVVYKKFGAIELMPMGYPNAVNQVLMFVLLVKHNTLISYAYFIGRFYY